MALSWNARRYSSLYLSWKVLERFGVPIDGDGRRMRVSRTVGGKGSSASINGCPVKVRLRTEAYTGKGGGEHRRLTQPCAWISCCYDVETALASMEPFIADYDGVHRVYS